jgi:hypothetical protein
MPDIDFSGQGDALLTEPLRAFRSWSVDIKLAELRRGRYVDAAPGDRYDLLRHLYGSMDPSTRPSSREWWETWNRAMDALKDYGVAAVDRLEDPPSPPNGVLMPDGYNVVTGVTLRPVTHVTSGHWAREREATCVIAQRTKDLLDGDDVMDRDHVAPEPDCTCGIYGWYRQWEARRTHTGSVTGTIKVSGDVIMGSRGLRAQRATIEAITVNADHAHAFAPLNTATMIEALRRETLPGRPLEGVVVCDTEQELRERFPADLGTVRNLLGDDVVDALEYGADARSKPVFNVGHPHTGAQLMAGPLAQQVANWPMDVYQYLWSGDPAEPHGGRMQLWVRDHLGYRRHTDGR